MKSGVRRINALVSADVFEDLQEIARAKNASMTEILRRAISLRKWFDDAQSEGARVMVERNEKLFEVAFL